MVDDLHAVIGVRNLTCQFGTTRALDDVSLEVASGSIHAVLGPNGAGKTTLLRVVCGLQLPTEGDVDIGGEVVGLARPGHALVGLVPSGSRNFYLRLTGLENLAFFARLQGLRRRPAVARAMECLRDVGLEDAAHRRVGLYSNGMQQRLAVARALLVDVPVLVVDEATHDLDPEGSRDIQALVAAAAQRRTAVLWATQRIDEIRGFADRLTVLDRGRVRFSGTVTEFLATTGSRRYLMSVQNGRGSPSLTTVQDAVAGIGTVDATATDGQFVLAVPVDITLTDVLARLADAHLSVANCWEDRSEAERAFLELVARDPGS